MSPHVGEDDLHAVVDGQLDADRHREVMAYLAAYPDAADRVATFFRQRVAFAALRERLADGDPGPEVGCLEQALVGALRRQQRVRRAVRAGGALAILLAAATSGWWLTAGRLSGEEVRHAAAHPVGEKVALTRALLAEAGPVVAVSAGDSAVLWLQAHLAGRALKQPNLEAFGLRLVGGNALKSAKGPAIRLLYADEKGRHFNLFVGVRESGVELLPSLVPDGHLALSWQRDPLVFALMAPQGSSRLTEVMRSAGDLLDPAPVAADAMDATSAATGTTGSESGGGASGRGDALAPAAPVVSKPL